MKRSDRPFVVGRRTRKATTVVLLDEHGVRAGSPVHPTIRGPWTLPGPWTVRAVVAPNPAR